MARAPRNQAPARRVRLRPQDPFDLIRLLARSQSDPRKAIGELVQNSLDAGASAVEIEWFNKDGRRALRIWDDGGGVFPDMEREEALRTIARTIGHSHKRDLTPAERREQMVLGQYGIGLIGFWSVGELLEIESRVGGGKPWVLRLREDRATAEVFPSRSRKIGDTATFTEITVKAVHEAVVNRIRPPRLQAYLANELRGQLLERGASVRIRDRVARGRARKHFLVEPRPYLGVALDEWRELEVPGFEGARIELYLVASGEDRRGVVSLSCGGTVVLDDIAEIDGADALRQPWCSGALEGVIDFPDLHVAPGSRRGFTHDEPVAAFVAALEELEGELSAHLEAEALRRTQESKADLTKQIRRAFRTVVRNLGDYDFFGVRGREGTGGACGADRPAAGDARVGDDPGGEAMTGDPLEGSASPPEPVDPSDESHAEHAPDAQPDTLFPPGPLAGLELAPRTLRIPPLATRGLRARALDADQRPCAGTVTYDWQLAGPGELEADGARAHYTAPERTDEDRATVRVVATQDSTTLEARARVLIVAPPGSDLRLQGIPEPLAVSAPGETWRSRLRDGRWEYNEAHRDYQRVAGEETRRFRYLVHLLAKELVLRNFGRPGDAEVLERMVEVLAHLELGRGRG